MKPAQVKERIRVLLVDDSAALRDAARRLLGNSERVAICGEAANGREALERATRLQPQVVVMDIGMPVMDGLEATRRMRRLHPDAEILIFTEHDSEHARNASLEAGARGCISKAAALRLEEAIQTVARHETYFPESSSRRVAAAAQAT
jgi:NarL family two-component system response regulator LiaR